MTRNWMPAAALCLAMCWLADAQTQVDLRAQSRNIDFSSAAMTKPFKTGTTLPATCTVGETYFKTDAPQGQNIYTCSSANSWAPTSSTTTANSGPGGVEVLKTEGGTVITARQLLPGEGLVLSQQNDTVTAEIDTAVVPRYGLSTQAPSGTCQDGRDIFTRTGGFPNFFTCVQSAWKPLWSVAASTPATCFVGELLFHSTEGALHACTATNTWTRVTNIGGVDVPATGYCFITTSCTPAALNGRGPLHSDAVAGKFAAVRVMIRDQVKLGKALAYFGGGSTTAAFTVAIYADNNGVPGTKIVDTDLRFVNLAAAGFHQTTWGTGTVVLTPKVYWVGFSSEDGAASYSYLGGTYGGFPLVLANLEGKPGAVTCSNPVVGSGETYLLPDTCGTATAWNVYGVDAPVIVASAE